MIPEGGRRTSMERKGQSGLRLKKNIGKMEQPFQPLKKNEFQKQC